MFNIAYITDDNYILPIKASVNSIIKNCSSTNICIHIICTGVSERNRQELSSLESTNIRVKIITFNNIYEDLCPDHSYISKAALIKFQLPWIFRDLDRILYIDGDTLLFSGFEQIFETDIDDYFAAVVMDMYTMKIGEWHKKLGLKFYFNSGVMYLNLEKMRRENCSEKLAEYQKNDKENVFMDQNALNVVFGEKVVFVSPKFNFLEAYKGLFQEADIEAFFDASPDDVAAPLIRHMAGVLKPWESADAGIADDFISYLTADDALKLTKEYCLSLSKKISVLEKQIAEQKQELDRLHRLVLNTRHRTLFGFAEWLLKKIQRRQT